MTAVPSAQPVTRTETGYLRTEVEHRDGGFVWRRSPGVLRPQGFRPVPPGPADALADALADDRTGARVVCGESSGDARVYRVDQPVAVGQVLLANLAPATWAALAADLAKVGAGLRRLHRMQPPPSPGLPPVGATRLAAWLRGAAQPAGTALGRLTAVFDDLLADRLPTLLAWCDAACVGTAGNVALHGGPSLGAILASGTTGRPTLLYGEEAATGPAEYDVAWLLGELWEFRLLYLGAFPEHRAACLAAEAALVDGYGPEALTMRWVHRLAVVRIATHAHDFAAYVGWTDQLVDFARTVADLVDRYGSGAAADRRDDPR